MKVGVGTSRKGAQEEKAQQSLPLCGRTHGAMDLKDSVPAVSISCTSGTKATWVSTWPCPQESS